MLTHADSDNMKLQYVTEQIRDEKNVLNEQLKQQTEIFF